MIAVSEPDGGRGSKAKEISVILRDTLAIY
jgi:hypothetical protein